MARVLTGARATYYKDMYDNATERIVTTFYGRVSVDKIKAENKIKEHIEMWNKNDDMHAYGYRILSGNCYTFVCGYLLECKSTQTKSLIIHTAYNMYLVCYDR